MTISCSCAGCFHVTGTERVPFGMNRNGNPLVGFDTRGRVNQRSHEQHQRLPGGRYPVSGNRQNVLGSVPRYGRNTFTHPSIHVVSPDPARPPDLQIVFQNCSSPIPPDSAVAYSVSNFFKSASRDGSHSIANAYMHRARTRNSAAGNNLVQSSRVPSIRTRGMPHWVTTVKSK